MFSQLIRKRSSFGIFWHRLEKTNVIPNIKCSVCSLSTYVKQGGLEAQAMTYSVAKQLQRKIQATGPISVAEYMREILTSPSKVRVATSHALNI